MSQHRSSKARRIATEAQSDPRTIEELRAARDAAWAKVTGNPNSSRWDLTKFEKADDLYRARCTATNTEYIKF